MVYAVAVNVNHVDSALIVRTAHSLVVQVLRSNLVSNEDAYAYLKTDCREMHRRSKLVLDVISVKTVGCPIVKYALYVLTKDFSITDI